MLVQASDQMEDVVDISTDNLKSLKEQAEGADTDTILRFIRIFSELSSNIRYATQKRILIEITLIRLCKPQMDKGRESLEDRIRALEAQNEKNIRFMGAIQSGEVAIAPAAGASPAVSVPKANKVLERAVPEDIKKLVNEWSKALARMENPMKIYMQKARLSLGNDDKLQIVFDNKQIADKYGNGDSATEFQNFIDGIMGKHVEYETRFLPPQQVYEENYVDLLQSIKFDIVTEDESEEE